MTHTQSKFDELASDKDMLQNKIIISNFKITELWRSVHKLEQYPSRECFETAEIPLNILHVILEDVVIKL